MMKCRTVLIWLPLLLILSTLPVHAEVEQEMLGTLELDHAPIDVAVSLSGHQIYVLDDQSRVLIFNTSGRLIDQLTVPVGTDQIKVGPREDLLFLGNRKNKTVKVIKLTFSHAIDLSDVPFKGPENAPVEIVVFSDFQCPYCARIGSIIERVREAYPDKVRSAFKNFPISSHKLALTAAKAAIAADAQGKFWEFHDLLFRNYNRLSDQKIDDIRLSLNLDKAKFEKVMKAPETLARINRERQEGQNIGVRGTPTVFVNGQKVRRANYDGIKNAVEEALNEE